jgi:predicted outer membrane protein
MRNKSFVLMCVLMAAALLVPSSSALARNTARRSTCAVDRAWLVNSLAIDRFELAGVQVAYRQTRTSAVLQLAGTIKRDDSRLLAATTSLLRLLHLSRPRAMQPIQHWSLHMIAQERDQAFDRDYAWMEVATKVQEIRDSTSEANAGCNPIARQLATTWLPYLQLHLRLASTWQSGPKSA